MCVTPKTYASLMRESACNNHWWEYLKNGFGDDGAVHRTIIYYLTQKINKTAQLVETLEEWHKTYKCVYWWAFVGYIRYLFVRITNFQFSENTWKAFVVLFMVHKNYILITLLLYNLKSCSIWKKWVCFIDGSKYSEDNFYILK